MRCYSHLSDDEREQIGLAKALSHSIGAIAQTNLPFANAAAQYMIQNGAYGYRPKNQR